MTGRPRLLAALLGLVFLFAHLRALPRTLEDIDSVNFALGVEEFDVARHRPHPPGYPIYVALTKASTAAVGILMPSWDRDRRAAVGLAIWSVIAGAAAAYVFSGFWIALGLSPSTSLLAATVAVVAPLFWFTAARPLTDTFALVGAVLVQTWIIRALNRMKDGTIGIPRELVDGAIGAGLLIGVRSQTLWLTAPLVIWSLAKLSLRRDFTSAGIVVGVAALGCLAWAIPLVMASGGVAPYLSALGSQGAEDFAGVEMLATGANGRMAQLALSRTFVDPWVEPSLAHVVLGLAVIGVVRFMRVEPRVLGILSAAFVPALAFHLAFHETETIRYALPFLVPVAGLAVAGLAWAGITLAALGTTAIVVTSLVLVQPRLQAYASAGGPIFRAFQSMLGARPGSGEQPVLAMHHQVWWGVQRTLEWYRPIWNVGPQPFPGDREWLALVEAWKAGRTSPVWFLTDTRRHDIDLIDPRHRSLAGRYRLDPSVRDLIGGARLDSLDWWRIETPLWMLGRGWSLTPEIAGMTSTDRIAGLLSASEGFVLRSARPLRMVVGGRYISGSLPADVIVELDGHIIAQWPLAESPNWFTRWIDLPAGIPAGEGKYATLRVRVGSAAAPGPEVVFEQFDLAGVDDAMFSLDTGWNELEENPDTGLRWRWSSDRSTILVKPGQRPLNLTLAGESPLKYFSEAPAVTIRAGTREIASFRPTADFVRSVPLPADAVEAAGGVVTIELDRAFVPAERGDSPDRRRLGLRLSTVTVSDVSAPPPSPTFQ